MPPMPAEAEAPPDLLIPFTASAACSAARAMCLELADRWQVGIDQIEIGKVAGQQICVGEAGELVLRRCPRHSDGPFGQARLRRCPLNRWWKPRPACARPARAGRDRHPLHARIPRPRPSRTSIASDIVRNATASAASAPAARAALTSRSARSVSGVRSSSEEAEASIDWLSHGRGCDAVQPPKQDNLVSGGNTSSIMVCNGASIIHREGLAATSG